MELTVIPHIDLEYVELYCLSDLHFGSPDCDEELLERDVDAIQKNPNAKVIINGDLLQMDTKRSKGDVYRQKYPPSQQKRLLRKLLAPIKDDILCIQGGNHDELRSDEDASSILDIAEWLGVKYTDTEMCLKIPVGSKRNNKPAVYCVFATHGWANGRLMGSKANNLHRLAEIVLADVYFISHTHTQIAFPDSYYVPDLYNNNMRLVTRYFVNSGSYQKRGQYPKSKGMRPTVLGTPKVVLSGKEKRVEVVV